MGPGHYVIGFAFADETIEWQMGQELGFVKGAIEWNGQLRVREQDYSWPFPDAMLAVSSFDGSPVVHLLVMFTLQTMYLRLI
jgi:hypothetical protein